MLTNESDLQSSIFSWAEYLERKLPELGKLYASANGGVRNIITARNLKRMGVRSGVPDIHLPVARCGYHSLYIEIKIEDSNSKESIAQKWWRLALNSEGHLSVVCFSYSEITSLLTHYIDGSFEYVSSYVLHRECNNRISYSSRNKHLQGPAKKALIK